MNWSNRVTELLGIRYPMIQAPMFGVTTLEMVAATAKAEALGSLSLGDLPADKCIESIRATKQLTDKPFAVNIFVHDIPELSDELKTHYARSKQFIEQLAQAHHLEVHLPGIDEIKLNSYHEQVDAIVSEQCKIVSFTFGNLDEQSIQKLKQNNTILIGTCTSVEEAKILERSGIDLICAQGIEAGGHRGSFAPEALPRIGGFSLLAQVFDQIATPLIYAGGLYDAKTVLAAKTLGAQGFQIGSLFLNAEESALQDFEKQRLKNAGEQDITLTNTFSGRYARGIRNAFISSLENTDYVLPYPYQNKLTNELRKVAKNKQNADFVSIWAGQSLPDLSEASVTEIIQQLIQQVENHAV